MATGIGFRVKVRCSKGFRMVYALHGDMANSAWANRGGGGGGGGETKLAELSLGLSP